MKTKLALTALSFLVFPLLLATAQTLPDTAAPDKLPTYVGLGAAFNQIGTPRVNIWATAIYPVVSSLGVYMSTTTDMIPVLKLDPGTGRNYYGFTTSIRQGAHKVVFSSGKFSALIGGDAGGAFSQNVPAGLGVSFTGSVTGTAVYSISNKWAVVVPVRAIWINSGWNLVPQIGILLKP